MCMEYLLNIYAICMEYVWNMSGRCFRVVLNMYGVWMECTWNIRIICMDFVRSMCRICTKFAWKICPWNENENCVENMWEECMQYIYIYSYIYMYTYLEMYRICVKYVWDIYIYFFLLYIKNMYGLCMELLRIFIENVRIARTCARIIYLWVSTTSGSLSIVHWGLLGLAVRAPSGASRHESLLLFCLPVWVPIRSSSSALQELFLGNPIVE